MLAFLSMCVVSALWIYGPSQWMRMNAGLLPIAIVVTGFASMIAALWLLLRGKGASLQVGFAGVATGIAAGIYADATQHESNLWPVGIVVWWVLASFGGVCGVAAVELLRNKMQRMRRK